MSFHFTAVTERNT